MKRPAARHAFAAILLITGLTDAAAAPRTLLAGAASPLRILVADGVATHDVAFWRAVAKNNFAVPAGGDAAALIEELVGMLSSPDPELRDEIAYSTLANWIYRQKIVDAAELRPLVARLVGNLSHGVGERGTDSVFGRSFSALVLSVIVARDNADAVLDRETWRQIDAAAVAYFAAEQDIRGFDPQKGWMHSAAHTADLLKFLARSRFVTVADQARYLDAFSGKLTTAAEVFTHGEDERMARAVLSVIARPDFAEPPFAAWVQGTKPAVADHPTLAQLHAAQNWKNFLAKLEVLLANDAASSEPATAARVEVRAALKPLF